MSNIPIATPKAIAVPGASRPVSSYILEKFSPVPNAVLTAKPPAIAPALPAAFILGCA